MNKVGRLLYCKYKNGKHQDAEKNIKKLFENVSSLRRNQKIFYERAT